MSEAAESKSDQPTAATRLPRGRPVALPLMPESPLYSMDDITKETGFTKRTVRYYVNHGLLTPAHRRGPNATYDKDHLLRLKMIRELKEQFLPLDEIKRQLDKISTEDLEAHFAIASAPVEGRWRRIEFGPNLELHVREREDRNFRFDRLVDQLTTNIRFMVDNFEDSK